MKPFRNFSPAKYLLYSGMFIANLALLACTSSCTVSYNGEKLFFKEGCAQCHSYNGKGGMMGPDLSAVSNLRSPDWIDQYIQDPKKMFPFSRMPSFPHLSKSKRRAIISFLQQ